MIDRLLRALVLRLSQPGASRAAPRAGRARAAALRLALRALLARRPLDEVLGLLSVTSTAATPSVDPAAIAQALRRTGASCLVRALAGYAALRAQGRSVAFVLGVRATEEEALAHAWLEDHGAPIGEPEDPRAHFTVALRHPPPAAAPTAPRSPAMSPLAPSPDVLLTELKDGTGVLLHLGTKFYYALNATGVVAWNAIATGVAADAGDVARLVVERFAGAEPGAVRRDVDALLAELAAEGLLSAGGQPAGGTGA